MADRETPKDRDENLNRYDKSGEGRPPREEPEETLYEPGETFYDSEASSYSASSDRAYGLRDGKLDIAGLVRRSFEALGQEAASLAGVALLVYFPMMLVLGVLMLRAASGIDKPEETIAIYSVGVSLINVLFVQILAAGAIVLLFARFRGRSVSISSAVKTGLTRIGSLIWLAILVGVTVMLGTLLCIVPGLIAQAALALAVPALMVEKISAADAWNRSMELTRGHRWPIFVIQIFFAIVGGGLSLALTIGLDHVVADQTTYAILYMPVSLMSTILLGILNAVSMVLIYQDLRQAKEGIDEASLVAVFE